ncbi:hypothetical protein M8C21_005345 [Ambrosia artemisiifolia]|uniref:Uncharacterized protein n=1 Tax=Ambrosia artemisiifolia TaxID=4212 RepID=A0AAD5CTV7_AMBAR|nr:hypothetical protein M8C21_005345 [Ambrosia artemisiifolia]
MERCCCPNSIESLSIRSCSSLKHVSFTTTTATGGGRGQKLKSLEIWDCWMPKAKKKRVEGTENARLFRYQKRLFRNKKELLEPSI